MPTLFVLGFMLNALPDLWQWAERGRAGALLRAWALLMVGVAGHHVTMLFGMVFFSGPILATILLQKYRETLPESPVQAGWQLWLRGRVGPVLPALMRCAVFGVGFIVLLVVTVLPYWLWSRSDPITQITIPHGSRDNFLDNRMTALLFFVIPWGWLILVLPYALYRGFRSASWLLAASLALLALLGTGGTTPIPTLLLQDAFYILTLDRFTFWATILILPYAGLFVESLLHGNLSAWIGATLGQVWRVIVPGLLAVGLLVAALFAANLTQFRRFQPPPVAMQPIVEFLARDDHDRWRYLTLGFGDQMAWLSAQTTALNVEGNYHSARRLPELTSTPIERLDGAKFASVPGLGSLQQFLTNPQRYQLKYIFVNDAFYEPLLFFAGWHRLGLLDNDVQVWERADVPPLPAAIPEQAYPDWQRLMWGILPISSLPLLLLALFFTGVVFPRLPLARLSHRRWLRFWWRDANSPPRALPLVMENTLPLEGMRPLARVRWLVRLAALGLVLGAVALGLQQYQQEQQSPEAILIRYYDDLDTRRFAESYDYLSTELSQLEYLRWLSLQGGLLNSYAKLENLYIETGEAAQGRVEAEVRAQWLTALGTYEVRNRYTLVDTARGWRIDFDVPPPPPPRETFVSAAAPAFYIDLPLVSLEDTTLTQNVLNRAALSLGPVQVIYHPEAEISFAPEFYDAERVEGRFQGLISLVGSVRNDSPFPAHITVTGVLRDAEGERLAETNAMDHLLHQLLPQEVTPFRIDFMGPDAAQILDVGQVASAEVVVRGQPTAYNLERDLVLLGEGQLYNAGTEVIDVPRVLVSHFAEDGTLAWVSVAYSQRAILPRQTRVYAPPPLPEGLQTLDLPVTVQGVNLQLAEGLAPPPVLLNGYRR
ncbi:MAG: hypothetical protein HC915_01490 [Anaerolineae bacterium]|nr:hypothetical protein [Anaerolineae bacterium]